MNINANEILLLKNKKINFNGVENTTPVIQGPIQEPNAPQTGLNTLMFKAMDNLVGNPHLAKATGFMNEVVTQPTEEKAETTAPFKSDVAFRGKFKSIAMSAMLGLATLGALSSCTKDEGMEVYDNSKTEVNQTVTVTCNYQEDETKWAAFYDLLLQLIENNKKQDEIDNQNAEAMLNYMKQLLELMQKMDGNANAYYEQMFMYMASSLDNQAVMIELLKQNGMKQDEANNYIQQLIKEVQEGKKSAAAAMQELLNKVSGIQASLDGLKAIFEGEEGVLAYLDKIYAESQKQTELQETTNKMLGGLQRTIVKYGEQGKIFARTLIKYVASIGLDMNIKFNILIEAVEKGNMKIDDAIALLDKLNNVVEKNGEEGKALGEQLLQYIAALGFDMNAQTNKLLEAVEKGNLKLDEAIVLLNNLNELSAQNLEASKELYQAICALGFDMNVQTNLLLDAVLAGNMKVDEAIAVLNKIAELQKEDVEGGKQLYQAICALGFDMNVQTSKLLDAVLNGNLKLDQALGMLDKLAKLQEQDVENGKVIYQAVCAFGLDMNVQTNKMLDELIAGNLKLDNVASSLGKLNEIAEKNLEASKELYQAVCALGFDMNVQTNLLLDAVLAGNMKVDEAIAVLNKIAELQKEDVEGGKQLYQAICALGFDMNVQTSKLLDAVLNGNLKLDQALGMLDKLAKLQEQDVENGKVIYQAVCAFGFDMNVQTNKILDELIAGNLKLDKVASTLERLNEIAEEDLEGGKQLYQAICALGFDMSVQTNKILDAVLADKENGDTIKDLLANVLAQLAKMDKADRDEHKEVITAISNIKVTGGNIDLGSVETMLDDLKKLLQENNQLLSNLNAKADVLNVTTKAIEEKMADEYAKNDIRYTNLMNLLEGIKDNQNKFDDSGLLAKLSVITGQLDEIMALLEQHNKDHKDHEVKVTVDVTGKVTCECDCQHTTTKPNEGVLGDLNDLLNNN